ncbi:MAG: alkene reductase [Flavobacteriales bacterium]|nr:alkene reductase [Flavobacteriales bacterium]
MKLFTSFRLGTLELQNRMVMAPMTRSRAIGNVPNDLMAEYYGQRANAGLIITEGTAPTANGLGYARIPGIYSDAQVEGWKKVTKTVHDKGGRIFIQLMHTGRVSHVLNMEEGTRVLSASAIALDGNMYTDQEGNQPYPIPAEMTLEDIRTEQQGYVKAAKNAIAAGFDGVELHGANGYLIDQFLNPASNQRTDSYGGSLANRNRFALEVAQQVAQAIGAYRLGIRISPNGVFNGMTIFPKALEQYAFLAKELAAIGLAYIHVVDHSSMGAPAVGDNVKDTIRAAFGGTIIVSGGLTAVAAEKALQDGKGELAAFGRPYISNPDLVNRLKNGLTLQDPDFSTFYTPGEKGYTDYPAA